MISLKVHLCEQHEPRWRNGLNLLQCSTSVTKELIAYTRLDFVSPGALLFAFFLHSFSVIRAEIMSVCSRVLNLFFNFSHCITIMEMPRQSMLLHDQSIDHRPTGVRMCGPEHLRLQEFCNVRIML
jgi:hypothetical protein